LRAFSAASSKHPQPFRPVFVIVNRASAVTGRRARNAHCGSNGTVDPISAFAFVETLVAGFVGLDCDVAYPFAVGRLALITPLEIAV
jgi:hypothetical protein